MSFEIKDIELSQKIFYYLLEHHQLSEEDDSQFYRSYCNNTYVQDLVKRQGENANAVIELYGSTIYLIPNEDNRYLGYSKTQLKQRLCKSGGTEADYCLVQFAIITLLVEFYNGSGSSARYREYLTTVDLMQCLSGRLSEGVAMHGDDGEETGLFFAEMKEAYEALKSEPGSIVKTTKQGFINNILRFLDDQGLIEYVKNDETIYPTKKLDAFMDWNLLNINNYDRVLRVLGVDSDE